MLTDKQQKVLDAITEYVYTHWKSPTIEELQITLNQKSKRWVTQYLEALERKWCISRNSGYRSIKLKNQTGDNIVNLPILWVANAWSPMSVAEENDNGVLPVSKNIISGDESNFFVLQVDGTSMNQALVNWKIIENGSYVLIKKWNHVVNENDVYLFIVNNCATIKKSKREWTNLYLIPDSKDSFHKPIILTEDDDVVVNGKVVDVFNF